ncbi:hypothetical protein SAMN05421783_11170 [Thiocapsa roseopersicina]|uniref:Uncharacterized protein n=1 Tax=Thiocapsa roseopersicina TaxID=1058 RepID=A0A1H2XQH1_THIRO|nr:hypothetical protein SAMN05421783_11170 [Thiocapsa roseopersicina]
MFQSAPDQLAGRCPARRRSLSRCKAFQSAPDQLAGRCLRWPDAASSSESFQSAPDQLAGRCSGLPRRLGLVDGFNPRPTNWPGDAGHGPRWCRACAVSIRARPIGRAMPSFRADPGRSRAFQSAPDQLAGRCDEAATVEVGMFSVSIRARPIGRAMPLNTPALYLQLEFQSAPDQLAGRCGRRGSCRRRAGRFNPRPTNWPGDATSPPPPGFNPICFNPRPTNWPGDARAATRCRPLPQRFNPRPTNWPGDAPRMQSVDSAKEYDELARSWPTGQVPGGGALGGELWSPWKTTR